MTARVLFVINSLAGGGAERVMATLLAHAATHHDPRSMALALLDDEPRAYTVPDWLAVHQLDARGGMVASARQLRALVERWRPDISLSFLTRSNIASGYAMAGRGKPWLISERVNTSAHLAKGAKGLASRLLVRLAYPRASGVIAVSQGVAEDLAANFAVPARSIRVIANPIDADALRARAHAPCPFEPPFIAAAGRLVPNKNFAMLVEAFARSGIPGRLVILGEGPLLGALRQLAKVRGVSEKVLLPGFQDNPFAILSRASAFVLSSNAEGFPNALVEAMALGIPVIATNCPSGPAEILAESARDAVDPQVPGRYGLLVPPDDVEAMAMALRALQDEAVREDYGRRAAARARDFSPERAAAAYWSAIHACLGH